MEQEVSSDSSVEIRDATENDLEDSEHVMEQIEDPKVGMRFTSVDEIHKYYAAYAKQKGFSIVKKSFKKGGDGEMKYLTFACMRAGKPRIRTSNAVRLRPQSKMGCKAGLNLTHCDGQWILRSCVIDHNHGMSPSKSRFFKCNRVLPPHVKRRLEINDSAGIRMNKSFFSLVVEGKGHKKLQYLEKDCRNYMDKIRRLRLKEGDAAAMHNYFEKMRADNSDFYYTMDLNEKGRLRNVFWADARSRAAVKEFGDVVTFDTTYLVNKYDMPFAPFVGVNHHGQSTLLGCGLISHEDTESFVWLFKSWLACMSCPPIAIITDQDKAMKKATEIVFPNTRHRWCLWHIMKKIPEKLKGYKEYKSIKFHMKQAVYDSLTKEEFEKRWDFFIKKYQLQSNDWLLGLYEERHRWVGAFVKDIFWAGMSTTQRSESMNAFFDGYINSKTTLKQFVEQYENALAKKVENENSEDSNSLNSYIPCITPFEFEKQFQIAYTNSKFQEVQREIVGKILCSLSTDTKRCGCFIVYEVEEIVPFGKDSHRRATFSVYFNEDTKEADCSCRLFLFRGIICRHQIVVFIQRKVYEIPSKYILDRWSKIIKRSHTKVRIGYDKFDNLESCNYDKMYDAFSRVVNLALDSSIKVEKVVTSLFNMEKELKEDQGTCGNDSTLIGNDLTFSEEGSQIVDPLIVRMNKCKVTLFCVLKHLLQSAHSWCKNERSKKLLLDALEKLTNAS